MPKHGEHHYGWRPDLPDQRDYKLADHEGIIDAAALPPSVDLRSRMPPMYDQGQLGSCTANSIAGGVQYLQKMQSIPDFIPSRLFIYYEERLDQGDVVHDTGSSIRESAKAVATYGCPPEVDWPYNIAQFANKPPDKAYGDALLTKVIQYLAVPQDETQMKSCLAQGFPIHVGFTVYQSFETAQVAQSGVVPMPGANEQVLGGHAVMVVGYDDSKSFWICRNSWGTGWGNGGYFAMPYTYLLSPNLASDFWTLRKVTGPTPPPPSPTPTPTPGPEKIHQIDIYKDGSYRVVL